MANEKKNKHGWTKHLTSFTNTYGLSDIPAREQREKKNCRDISFRNPKRKKKRDRKKEENLHDNAVLIISFNSSETHLRECSWVFTWC